MNAITTGQIFRGSGAVSPILQLPNEILTFIFGHLNQLDTVQVLCVSRQFYKLGVERLYNSIYINDGESKLLVSSRLHTGLYLKYAIINGFDLLKQLKSSDMKHLIKSITCEEYESNQYRTLVSWFPGTKIINEGCHLVASQNIVNPSHTPVLYLNRYNYIFFNTKFQECNFSIKQLTIDFKLPVSDILDIMPMFKGVEVLDLRNTTSANLSDFEDRGFRNIKLKGLYLHLAGGGFSNEASASRLSDLFNLSTITSFGLTNCYRGNQSSEMVWLLGKLSSLTRLYLDINVELLYDAVCQVRPHTLTSLFIQDRSDISSLEYVSMLFQIPMPIWEMIIQHGESLINLGFSSRFIYPNSNSIVDVFERVYLSDDECTSVINSELEAAEVLFNDGYFPRLNMVVINEHYFEISHGNESVTIALFDRSEGNHKLFAKTKSK
ncbi:uncharacterized protein SPAPADRAFT_52802 [Spathaspora passalidarum NRRL Y-27907]|uniref:F-box domain-containing protein n=1 Tax=Spathaspora passalidarum (strain NRRL Y-27907 / 11-Y1) TaxID=619300 RepID=G3AVK2_SPAPN|nr:uncharacterized protein SPAPADRAFT_52802 [Spathaspora passalidarum NRRL Y-27907]EGW29951.1 hypothetical protein SPAPADRAFT_52802 [Spathaspora passalidarum NRRL Y-27907]